MKKKLDKHKIVIKNDIRKDSKYFLHVPIINNLPLSVTGAGHFIAKKNYLVNRTGLNMFLLFYTLSGNGELEYHDKTYLIKKNDIFLINALDYHRYNTSKLCDIWEFKWIRFTGIGVAPYYNYINDNKYNLVIIDSPILLINNYFDEVIDMIIKQVAGVDFRISNLLVNILTELCSLKISTYPNTNIHDAILASKQYILNHFNSNISIELLAKSYYFNKFTFIRNFKKVFGINPYAFIIKTRINHARSLLEQSTISIEKIAKDSGFNDINCFIRSFKKLLNVTPLQYRKKMNG